MVDRRKVLLGGATLAIAAASSGVARAQAGAAARQSAYSVEGKAALGSYRKAVQVMRDRSDTNFIDPAGWVYQGMIHGILNRRPKATFIARIFAPVPPTDPRRLLAEATWATCPHGTEEFLAWHRLYVHYFEKIVREASSDPDFHLPYWDYSADDASRVLPVEFREPLDGSPLGNPLFNHARDPLVNGLFGPPEPVPASDVMLDALREPFFQGSPTRDGLSAALENMPHNLMHTDLGGGDGLGTPSGDMSVPDTAGRDPIFWLHHSNIDRLWESWMRAGGETIEDYSDRPWYSRRWTFVDVGGSPVDMSLAELGETGRPAYASYAEIGRDPITEGPATVIQVVREVTPLAADGLTATLVTTASLPEAAGSLRVEIVGVVADTDVTATIDVFLVAPDGIAMQVGAFNFFGASHDMGGSHHDGMSDVQATTMPKRYVFTAGDYSGPINGLSVQLRPRRGKLLEGSVEVGSISIILE